MTTEADVYDALKYRVDVSPITGTRRYYNHAGQLHREDGPAIEWAGGEREWRIWGTRSTEEEYHQQLKTLGTNEQQNSAHSIEMPH